VSSPCHLSDSFPTRSCDFMFLHVGHGPNGTVFALSSWLVPSPFFITFLPVPSRLSLPSLVCEPVTLYRLNTLAASRLVFDLRFLSSADVQFAPTSQSTTLHSYHPDQTRTRFTFALGSGRPPPVPAAISLRSLLFSGSMVFSDVRRSFPITSFLSFFLLMSIPASNGISLFE